MVGYLLAAPVIHASRWGKQCFWWYLPAEIWELFSAIVRHKMKKTRWAAAHFLADLKARETAFFKRNFLHESRARQSRIFSEHIIALPALSTRHAVALSQSEIVFWEWDNRMTSRCYMQLESTANGMATNCWGTLIILSVRLHWWHIFFLLISSFISLSTGQISVFLMPPLGGTKVWNQPVSYLLYTTSALSHFPASPCFPLDVPMDTSASHLCQGVPASPVIAMATWTYPYLAAVIQSLDSVCAVDRAMAAPIATVVLKGTTETPSQQKTASVSKQRSNLSICQ